MNTKDKQAVMAFLREARDKLEAALRGDRKAKDMAIIKAIVVIESALITLST